MKHTNTNVSRSQHQDWRQIREALAFYQRLNLCCIPLIYGDKKPAVAWQPYQNRKPSFDEIVTWFHEGKETNLGIVCGAKVNPSNPQYEENP